MKTSFLLHNPGNAMKRFIFIILALVNVNASANLIYTFTSETESDYSGQLVFDLELGDKYTETLLDTLVDWDFVLGGINFSSANSRVAGWGWGDTTLRAIETDPFDGGESGHISFFNQSENTAGHLSLAEGGTNKGICIGSSQDCIETYGGGSSSAIRWGAAPVNTPSTNLLLAIAFISALVLRAKASRESGKSRNNLPYPVAKF